MRGGVPAVTSNYIGVQQKATGQYHNPAYRWSIPLGVHAGLTEWIHLPSLLLLNQFGHHRGFFFRAVNQPATTILQHPWYLARSSYFGCWNHGYGFPSWSVPHIDEVPQALVPFDLGSLMHDRPSEEFPLVFSSTRTSYRTRSRRLLSTALRSRIALR